MVIPESKCIIWNKQEEGSPGKVANSDIGPNPVTTGIMSFIAMVFNLGSKTVSLANYITYAIGTAFNTNAFSIETHFQTTYSYNDAVPSDAGNHFMFSFDKENGAPHNMWFFGFHSTLGLILELWVNGSSKIFMMAGSGITFNANEDHHIAVYYNQGKGLGGGTNTVEVWFDGILKYVSAVTPSIMAAANAGSILRTHLYGYDAVRLYTLSGGLDNIKVYNDSYDLLTTAIEDNKNTEAWPVVVPVPTNVLASDGLYITHTEITWDDMSVDTYTVYRSDTLGGIYVELQAGITGFSYSDTTGTLGTVYYYKVSSTLDAVESDLSDADSGYRLLPKIIIPKYLNKQPKVLILGKSNLDIWKLGYITNVPRIVEYKTFKRDKLFSNRITIRGINYDDFFSTNNPKSIFSNINWQYGIILAYDRDNNLVWNGLIEDIKRNHDNKTFSIDTVDHLYKTRNKKIVYTSSDYETPAAAFKNICDSIGFTFYSNSSVSASHAVYEENNCYIKCRFLAADEITFQQVVEKLGEIGCADTFSNKGFLAYKHVTPFTGGAKINVAEKDLSKRPFMYGLEKDIINDYSITYEGSQGIPVTDLTGDNIGALSRTKFDNHPLPDLDCDIENQISFKDKASAVYIGNCFMIMTHGKDTLSTDPKIRQGMDIAFGSIRSDWFDLDTYFKIDISAEGLTGQEVETYKTDIDIKTGDLKLSGIGV